MEEIRQNASFTKEDLALSYIVIDRNYDDWEERNRLYSYTVMGWNGCFFLLIADV